MRRDDRPEARPQRGRRGEPIGGLRSTIAPPVLMRIFLSLDFPLNSQISNRRQNRERLTRAPQPQFIRVCGFLRNLINPPRGRSIATGSNHICDRIVSPVKHGLDAAVAAVSHPALQAKALRLMRDPGPVAHALHLPRIKTRRMAALIARVQEMWPGERSPPPHASLARSNRPRRGRSRPSVAVLRATL